MLLALLLALPMTLSPSPIDPSIRLEPVSVQRVLSPRTAAQRVALRSLSPEFCYSGRRAGGKSWVLCGKAYLYATLYPGARVLIAREERASMDATTLWTLREEIVPREIWTAFWREAKSDLALPNGSIIHVRGLDKVDRILGLRVGFAGVDQAEQLDETQFEIVNSCVMQIGMPWHQTFLAFNPADPEHWAYKRYMPDDGDGVRMDSRGIAFAEVVHVQPDDLIDLMDETSRERFDRMTGVLRLRLRLGQWAASEGLVFVPPWDSAIHMVAAPDEWFGWGGYPPPDWPRYRGIDFGYDPDPFVCQWWAEGPERRRYLYREVCQTLLNPEQQAARIVELEAEEMTMLRTAAKVRGCEKDYASHLEALNVAASYSDHQRGERAMLAARGVATSPAQKDVTAGIATLIEMLNPDAPGGPRLLVVRGYQAHRDERLVERKEPTCFTEELVGKQWRSGSATRRDLPQPGKDHCLDAARYVHHSLEVYGRVGVWA